MHPSYQRAKNYKNRKRTTRLPRCRRAVTDSIRFIFKASFSLSFLLSTIQALGCSRAVNIQRRYVSHYSLVCSATRWRSSSCSMDLFIFSKKGKRDRLNKPQVKKKKKEKKKERNEGGHSRSFTFLSLVFPLLVDASYTPCVCVWL